MAKNDVELQALEQPKSRNEEYLNFLCGRAVDINSLPDKPYSRVEHYLEYLCHNRGQGGGGQPQPFNGVERVAYDTQNKRLTVTYTNGAIDNLDLANLSDTTEVQYDNNTHIMTVTRNGVATQIDLSKLNTKINNVAPVDGNIQLALNQAGDDISLTVGGQDFSPISLADYLKDADTTNVGGQPNADKIVKLGADGKLSETMIPDLAITRVVTTNDRTTAEQLVTSSQIQVGDVVVLTQDANKVYMYNGNTQGNFENKFIELSLGDGTVKEVNGQRPTNTGAVTIDASQINLQSDTTTVQEELDKKVESWGDLEYLIEHKITNIFNKDVIIDSQRHHANGIITTESEWCRYEISCKPNEVISIAKKKHDSQVITFLNSSGNRVVSDSSMPKSVNGWQHYIITVPSNNDIEKVSINIYKPHNPLDGNSVMIYKGDKEPTTEYYPFANGYNVIIDGSKVALTFDPTGSSLASLTTHDAIIELDKKIVNAGGGTVTSVNGVMPNGGDVELTAVISHPNKNILLRVGNQDFATLECMTEQDANDIIDSFTL